MNIKRHFCSLILITVCTCFGLYGCVSWYFSSLIIIADRKLDDQQRIGSASTYLGYEIESLKFNNITGEPFDAWLLKRHLAYPDKRKCAVIFTHGWGGSRVAIDEFLHAFTDTPCDFVTYDLRGHGVHEAPFSSGGILEKTELAHIHTHLYEKLNYPRTRIGWFGVSLGGATALQAAITLDNDAAQPAFIVVDSPFQDWQSAIFERGERMYGQWVHAFKLGVRWAITLRGGFDYRDADTLTHAANITSPVLLIHSKTDTKTDSTQSINIFKHLSNAQPQLHHTDWGADHAKDAEEQPERYKSLINQFIQDAAPQLVERSKPSSEFN